MRILCLNCGSSSLKFSVRDISGSGIGAVFAKGAIDAVGGPASKASLTVDSQTVEHEVRAADQGEAALQALALLREARLLEGIEAVGHRVVHGGRDFASPAVITDEVIAALETVSELAPLHNQPALMAIRFAVEHLPPSVPQLAVFDTSFYSALPSLAATYAIPKGLAEKYAIRRYGFHGLAHRYMLERARDVIAKRDGARIVSLQLGSGCSATASVDGRPVDTSMGFTPLEGLVMGTRSGDLDPSLPLFIAEKERLSPDAVESLLNRESGLLGLSGMSADMREIEAAAGAGNRDSAFALEAFCYRITKYVGAFTAAMGGVDALLFGGGIAEHSASVRRRVCESLAWLGLQFDPTANVDPRGLARISLNASTVEAWVVPVDEDDVIARDVFATLHPSASLPSTHQR